jgi:hypothetical protein
MFDPDKADLITREAAARRFVSPVRGFAERRGVAKWFETVDSMIGDVFNSEASVLQVILLPSPAPRHERPSGGKCSPRRGACRQRWN